LNDTCNDWSGIQIAIQFYQGTELKDMILLDSESSTSIFSNPSHVKDIHKTAKTLEMVTNGGKLFTNLKATVPGFGLVWYAPKLMTNIFSLTEMEEKH
jgi:hypothetical protein